MYLHSLSLINFKNYPEAEFVFDEGVNCFVGENGSGKTNLLDSIHYLSLCKSYFNAVDTQNIRHDEPFFVIQGTFIAPPPPEGGISTDGKRRYETADPILYGLLKAFVHEHRSQPTEAENVFWQLVRDKRLEGYKFRRQHIIGSYIADFTCLEKNLVIEIDGLIHQLPDNKVNDEQRTAWLNQQGFKVLRFANEEVIGNSEGTISAVLNELRLPPLGGGGAEHIYCGFKRGQGKIFKRNQKEYARLADHIGLLPVVMITPVDNVLITEGSEERRKLMDSIISQYDRVYLDDLITYNKVLSQRNALLKSFVLHKRFDPASLEIWDEQMIPLAEKIYNKRLLFINEFTPIFKKHYASLSGDKEYMQLEYESQLHRGSFSEILKSALDKDRALQYTGAGIHKDDLHFLIDGYPLKRFASQGQQKSFLIAVKLAQFDFIRNIKMLKPLLLLDDIFDKLDEARMRSLLQMVSHHDFGQIFLTDTHPTRAKEIFDSIHVPVKLFKIERGSSIEV